MSCWWLPQRSKRESKPRRTMVQRLKMMEKAHHAERLGKRMQTMKIFIEILATQPSRQVPDLPPHSGVPCRVPAPCPPVQNASRASAAASILAVSRCRKAVQFLSRQANLPTLACHRMPRPPHIALILDARRGTPASERSGPDLKRTPPTCHWQKPCQDGGRTCSAHLFAPMCSESPETRRCGRLAGCRTRPTY